MFGDEWAAAGTFPNRIVGGGEHVEIGDALFAVTEDVARVAFLASPNAAFVNGAVIRPDGGSYSLAA